MRNINENMNHNFSILTDFNLGGKSTPIKVCIIIPTDFTTGAEWPRRSQDLPSEHTGEAYLITC